MDLVKFVPRVNLTQDLPFKYFIVEDSETLECGSSLDMVPLYLTDGLYSVISSFMNLEFKIRMYQEKFPGQSIIIFYPTDCMTVDWKIRLDTPCYSLTRDLLNELKIKFPMYLTESPGSWALKYYRPHIQTFTPISVFESMSKICPEVIDSIASNKKACDEGFEVL
jgi:hypothetical protein